MGFYHDLYNNIENPLDKTDVMQKLVAGFANHQNMYNILMSSNGGEKKYKGKMIPQVKDDFYKKLFSIWRFNVLSLSDEQIEFLINHKKVGNDYYLLREVLKTKSEISGYDEYVALVNDENSLFDKYGWHVLGDLSGWIHISSGNLTARRGKDIESIEHRLYLNTENIDTESIASAFIDKCMNRNIPFYFKYDDYGNRDDTIVIYSDSNHLQVYIEILREIRLENTEIASRIQTPPLLTGTIDGWIGYGSEPQRLPDGSLTSFNEIRSKAIQTGFEDSIYDWIYKNLSKPIKYNGKMINLFEYLVIKITQNVILRYRKILDGYEERGSVDKFFESYGIVAEDFQNDRLKSIIAHYVRKFLVSVVNLCCKKEPINLKEKIPTRQSKSLSVYDQDFKEVFAEILPLVIRNNPAFIEIIKENIIKESAYFGVDPQKYCFDVNAREKLFAQDIQLEEDFSDPKR